MRADFLESQVGPNQPDAAVRDDEAIGDEIMIGMVNGEIVDQIRVFARRHNRGDALPDQAAGDLTNLSRGAIGGEGREAVTHSGDEVAPVLDRPVNELLVAVGRDESLRRLRKE